MTQHGRDGLEQLRRELVERRDRDQEMRRAIMEKYRPGAPVDVEDSHWWARVDGENTEFLKDVIASWGWPTRSLVGDEASKAAWLLVQHADRDVAFQKECLALMEDAVGKDDVTRRNYAYLVDRVRVNEGQPQLFGTQMRMRDGRHMPAEIEDADRVDERRAWAGLEPLSKYVERFNEEHKWK